METIVAAAICYRGTVYQAPAPGRHHHVIGLMAKTLKLAEHPHACRHQGFVTSTGRYVSRSLACLIASRAGQIKVKTGGARELYSEDVW